MDRTNSRGLLLALSAAILLAAICVGCAFLGQSPPAGAGAATESRGTKTGGRSLDVAVSLRSGERRSVQFNGGQGALHDDVSDLIVGVFDNGDAAQTLGYLYTGDAGAVPAVSSLTAANAPFVLTASDSVVSLLGTAGTGTSSAGVSITADKANPRRFLVRNFGSGATFDGGVTVIRFSNLPETGASHSYIVFAAAFDGAQTNLGYAEVAVPDGAVQGASSSAAPGLTLNLKNGVFTNLLQASPGLVAFQPKMGSATAYEVSTLAGNGTQGLLNGTGTNARFKFPIRAAADVAGNFYVADQHNHCIRKITSAGVVTILAGSGTAGFSEGTGGAALFNQPFGVAVDDGGNVYVADKNNHRIRKITPGGAVSTLAGGAGMGTLDATGEAAQFNNPEGVAVDSAGNVYVADTGNARIRKVTPFGVVTTLAGSTGGYADGTGAGAKLSPNDLAVDGPGNLYVVEYGNNCIRKVTQGGVVTTFAGTTTAGFADGPAAAARFNGPSGIGIDAGGYLYVADTSNQRIRKVSPSGNVTTLAGSGTYGYADGPAGAADFRNPQDVAVSASGQVIVADNENHRLRQLDGGRTVEVLAGNANSGHSDGTGEAATFGINPPGIAVDPAGNVFVGDVVNHCIRKITPAGVVSTFAGAPGSAAFQDGVGGAARFNSPAGVALDAAGNLYVADQGNHRIRKISPAGVVSTLAGSGTQGFADGAGGVARFNQPTGVGVDAAGNVLVADYSNNRLRRVTPGGTVSTIAGTGGAGNVDGPGASAQIAGPNYVALDSAGNAYVSDGSYQVRKVAPDAVVSTWAGSGASGSADGTGTAAQFNVPMGLVFDADGNLYVADRFNGAIRKITPAGHVTTLSGLSLGAPFGLAIDTTGTLHVTDGTRIKKVR